MDPLNMLMAALDDAHEWHEEGCDCYWRLTDAIRSGVYRFPPVSYGVAMPPVYGCKTPIDAAVEAMQARIAESVFGNTRIMVKHG